ncbi:hydantoinase/oxoprolinase family protein [Microbacterium sediminicola]|uniref:Hydantoinase/oxoprolinase family protein n=1 Tax=Microbacterium sediminicola TaxID=415210 RepID=A0ABN2HHV8_9MICO
MSAQNVIAIDIGGTHTDAALLDAEGRLFTEKVKSTPTDPGIAFLTAIDGLRAASGLDLPDIGAVVHGTTVATNAVIQARFARVGLLTTAGFEDILEIATQQRVDLYDPWLARPAPLVPRGRVHGIRERIGADGSVVTPLDETDVRTAARALAGAVDAVAVSLLFSFANPAHEERIAAILAEELPGVPVTVSSEIAPEFREYPRTATTVLNAALLPECGGYIERLETRLRDRGFVGAFQLMTSSGGVIPAQLARRQPVALLVSGPAGGAIAAAELGTRLGIRDVVMLDVGGTSADIAVIADGSAQHRYRGEVGGMPVALPQIDVLPIGAGGGSLAVVDEFGSLRVGPDSAGADPGPAAYGTGTRATTTDGHVVRGILDPAGLLGGKLPLDAARSRAAVAADVAQPLGMTVPRAAGSIARIANARMADALRVMTIARGIDIRAHALMAFGGAGPLHACDIADELGIARVIVPRYPGLTSALGLVMSDGRLDLARTLVAPLDAIDAVTVDAVTADLRARAAAQLGELARGDGVVFALDADLRYAGQAYELTIPVPDGLGAAAVPGVAAAFHERHRQVYGHAWPQASVELVTLRLRVAVPRAGSEWAATHATGSPVPATRRAGYDLHGEPVDYAVVDRGSAAAGLEGPAIVTQTDTTTVIPAGWRIAAVAGAGMILERGERT